MTRPQNYHDSLRNLLAFSSKDWGAEREGAWIYGIVFGWDTDPDDVVEGEAPDDAMVGLAARHGWDDDEIARLRRLHAQFIADAPWSIEARPVGPQVWERPVVPGDDPRKDPVAARLHLDVDAEGRAEGARGRAGAAARRCWMGAGVMMCLPCDRSARKPGRHRAHPCDRGGTTETVGYVCGCACNRPSSRYVPPPMAIDSVLVETPAYVVWWRESDVDDQGNVRPVAVATLGEPEPSVTWHACTDQPCCSADFHIVACPSETRRQEADRP